MDLRRETTDRPPDSSRDQADASDRDLLVRYCATRSAGAFRRLAERHAPLVLHTAFRLVGNWHDAEDVSQAVFLVLAQRAGSIKCSLCGWLHKVARDLSLQVLRARSRRARREEDAVRRKVTAATESELREELDVALLALPDGLREAVVLRYLEGRGQEEAARLAGCDKGTLSRRCSAGLNRLGAVLSRRGVVVAPALLTGLLAQEALASVPAAALTAVLGAGSTVASTQASLLAKGAVSAMFWAKAKLAAAALALATIGTGAVVVPLIASSSSPASATKLAAAPKEVLFRLDFEDGKLPAVCTGGRVVKGPDRPGNRFCIEGDRLVFLEKKGGLLTYSDDLYLVFDLWVDARVSTVDLHWWNQTQQASQGIDSLRPPREQWVPKVVVKLADFKAGTGAKPGDVISSLAIQAGQLDTRIYVDNLELVRTLDPSALGQDR